MSQFTFDGSIVTDPPVRLVDNTATAIFPVGETKGIQAIASIIVCPNIASTPTYTITEVAPDATIRFIWKGTAPAVFNEVFILPALYVLKCTSSAAAGELDVTVTHGTIVQGPRPGVA